MARAVPSLVRMTAPRQLLKGATYMITRNCVRGEFRLKPGVLQNRLFGYSLARAAEATGVRVHVACVMSSHYHLVVTDPQARLPEFQHKLNGEVGRALNALYGLDECLWRSGSYHALLLDSPDVVVDRCAYVLANPVNAGLVRKARKWPGFWTGPEVLGGSLEFERPAHFFDPNGHTPERARLRLHVPDGFESRAAFREQVAAALLRKEEEARGRHASFVGVARILAQRVRDHARTKKPRRVLRPRFAARDPGRRMALARRLKAFLAAYADALCRWSQGERDVCFPEGTYQMRVQHAAVCAGAG